MTGARTRISHQSITIINRHLYVLDGPQRHSSALSRRSRRLSWCHTTSSASVLSLTL